MKDIEIKLEKEKLIHYIKSKITKDDLSAIEMSILDKNDPFLSYLFAREIKNCNISSHLKVVTDSNDYQTMYTFAMEIDCDKTLITEKIAKSGIAKWMYFLAWAKGVDIKLLEDSILETGDINYIYMFGLDVPQANKERIAKYILQSGNIYYINLLGRYGIKRGVRENAIKEAEEKIKKEMKLTMKK